MEICYYVLNVKDNKLALNIGCGKTRIPGCKGVDKVYISGFTDIVHNLETVPYPFKNNSVDEIHMYHVLEHLHDPLLKLEEIHRILKPGGILFLRVPHFSSMGAFTDITHIRPFGYTSFDCLEVSHQQHFYTDVSYEIVQKQIKYFGLYPNIGLYEQYIHNNSCPKLIRPLVRFVNFLIRLSPMLFERVWCYWVGGAIETVVILRKI